MHDLYQELIIDHGTEPRNKNEISHNKHAHGFNPLCGDKITLYLQVDANDVIADVGFVGDGCAISTASASIMTETIKGKSISEALQLFKQFTDSLTTDSNEQLPGKLEALAGVNQYPMRVKCATLAWHTLSAAIDNKPDQVTTE